MNKPKPFAVVGATHYLDAFRKDLISLGYNITGDYTDTIQNEDDYSNTLEEYKEMISRDIPVSPNCIEFKLPADFVKAYDYAKTAIESTYWMKITTFEEGKWYMARCTDNPYSYLFKATGVTSSDAGCLQVGYTEMYNTDGTHYHKSKLGLPTSIYSFATDEEIHDRLLMAAKRKGFVKGVSFLTPITSKEFVLTDELQFHNLRPNCIVTLVNWSPEHYATIYDNKTGKWATLYYDTETTFTLSNGEKVYIRPKKYIRAAGHDIPVDDLTGLLRLYTKVVDEWNVTLVDATYKIGCWENVKLEDINKILAVYNRK